MAGSERTTIETLLGLLDVWVARVPGGLVISVQRSDRSEPHDGGLSAAAARIVVNSAVVSDVRLARQIERGKRIHVDLQVANANRLDTPRPHQTSAVAGLLRPYFEPEPDLTAMFPYQLEGARWLEGRTSALLADEMGLGKTAQVISALRLLVHKGDALRILVACPKSLVRNWRTECERWGPELLVGTPEPQAETAKADWHEHFAAHHIAIVNYEKLRNLDIARAAEVDILVADEAHRIRNAGSDLSVGIRSVHTLRRWAITGTPIERSADDLATILAFLDPMRFATDDARLDPEALRSRAVPYTLRRTKAAVLSELPAVLEHRERLELLPAQRAAYDRVVSASKVASNALATISLLREICDADPVSGASAKIERAREILKDVSEAGEKIIVFSYFLRPLRLLATALEREGFTGQFGMFEGALSGSERAVMLKRFKQDPKMLCLLASTRVASEGLTLTEANHVFFMNQWWNPSSNAQARDRVVRIGQERLVHVYISTCEDTIEERLEEILTQKDKTYSDVVERLSGGERSAETEALARRLIAHGGR